MHAKAGYIAWAGIFLAAGVFLAGCLGGILPPREMVVSPHIDPVFPGSGPIISAQTFPFEKETVTISVQVNGSVYQGAKMADKSVTVYGNVSENEWIADSYRSMVNDPAQAELYENLIAEFRKIRDGENLSDDEYLELITTYVQSLRYETIEENPAKFPVETVAERSGDCDDRSLLLAGLLSREGYQVALLEFVPEAHMAVGAGSSDYLYGKTNYTYIETTNLSFVGVPPQTLENNITLRSDPVIIPIGNGMKIYHDGSETRYINEMDSLSLQKAQELGPQIQSLGPELKTEQEKIQQLESEMTQMKSSGDVQGYNAKVSVHNTLVSDYNNQLDGYRQLYSRYENYALVHNYITDHQFDRAGVYEYVKNTMPA